jgi:hypothetical protein
MERHRSGWDVCDFVSGEVQAVEIGDAVCVCERGGPEAGEVVVVDR